MENNNKKSLIDFIDIAFVVGGEMIENNGEDSYAYSLNDSFGLIGVFDGCGGIGSRKYSVYDNKTGAYLASHTVANVVLSWFKEFSERETELSKNNAIKISDELTERINAELSDLESAAASSVIKGSLTKSFPTTASIILFNQKENDLYTSYIWAGDSRGFVLTSRGLAQITIDDIEESGDALSNLTDDGRLTNVISASKDYKLNHRNLICNNPSFLITATDGCFGYFSTPMEFEYMLIDTLLSSDNQKEWKENINNYILKYTGDDYTIGVIGVNFKNGFKTAKSLFANRKKQLYKDYISKLKKATEQEKIDLWLKYKKEYYRGV